MVSVSKIIQFVKEKQDDIILVIGVILISLLSFAAGYIAAKNQEKAPLIFEEVTYGETKDSYSGSWDYRTLLGLEIS